MAQWTEDSARQLAAGLARSVAAAGGPQLDYSEESVVMLDQEIEKGWPKGSMSQEMSASVGCYVGEVLVRQLGGQWAEAPDEPRVDFAGGSIMPISRAREALDGSDDYPLARFYATCKALSQQGTIKPIQKKRRGWFGR